MYKNLVTAVVPTLVAACFSLSVSPAFSQSPAPVRAPLKIGFVYVTPVTEAGWVRQHDIATSKLQPFKARTALMDNEGHEVLAAGKTLSDEQILGMNFLVQGVQGVQGVLNQ